MVSQALQLATQHHQAKRFAQAHKLYRQVLAQQPKEPEALYGLSRLAEQSGQYEHAQKLLTKVLEIEPQLAKAWFSLGNVYQAQGQLDEARAAYQQALEIQPQWEVLHNNLGYILEQQGFIEQAIACYQKALELEPNCQAAQANLGNARYLQGELTSQEQGDYAQLNYHLAQSQSKQGNWQGAIAYYRQAIKLKSDWVEAYDNLGVALQKSRLWQEARQSYQQALQLNPHYLAAHYNLGNLFRQQGQFELAQKSYQQALNINPHYALAYYGLGNLSKQQGKLERATDYYQRALAINFQLADVHHNLGKLSEQQGKLKDAVKYYQQALRINPNLIEVYNNLGNLLKQQEQFALAVEVYQRALQINPNIPEIYYNLASTLRKQGKSEPAIVLYQQALELKSNFAEAEFGLVISQLPIIYGSEGEIELKRHNYQQYLHKLAHHYSRATPQQLAQAALAVGSKQPFYLAYQGLNDRSLQQTYGKMITRFMASRYPHWSKSIAVPKLGATDKIRVGLVSGFFRNHSNWKIPIKGWVENFDKNKFELFGYHTGSKQDGATVEAQQKFDKFVQGPLSVEKWCEVIEEDRLQVLIFPEFGMDPVTVQLGCLRLAPVQMTSWGHPDTSGLPNIDYYLSSDLMEPEDAQGHYTEKLVKLPNLSIFYNPLKVEPEVRQKQDIGVEPGEIMFWCCQSLYKYLPQHDDVFPRIAQELRNSKFVFIKNNHDAGEQVTEVFKQRLQLAFEKWGLNYQDYCIFLPRLNSALFAGTVAIADVFLDSIGWSGCNSTLEAIAFNLPIVTIPGKLMRARHSMAILTMMGVKETIASSKEDYIQLAVRLGQNCSYRQQISQQIAENKHKLYGDVQPIRALEKFLEEVVRK